MNRGTNQKKTDLQSRLGPWNLSRLASSILFPLQVHSASQSYFGDSDLLYTNILTEYIISFLIRPNMTFLRCVFTKLPFYWHTSPDPPNSAIFTVPIVSDSGFWALH